MRKGKKPKQLVLSHMLYSMVHEVSECEIHDLERRLDFIKHALTGMAKHFEDGANRMTDEMEEAIWAGARAKVGWSWDNE